MIRSTLRWWGISVLVVGSCAVGARSAAAQSGYLQPGDVAVTCVDTSGTVPGDDRIQVTPLVALPALTDIRYQLQYTDVEADVDGVFLEFDENQSEIPLGGAKRAGEPTMYAASGLMGPDEQVFLFQGSLDQDTGGLSPGLLLWGFQMSSAGGWAATRTEAVSELPRSLQAANVALKSNGASAFAYTGPTTGSRAELQAAIGDPGNWMAGATCPTGFTVTAPADGGTDGDASDTGTDLVRVDTDSGDDGDGAGAGGATGAGGTGTGDSGAGGQGEGGSGAPDASGTGGAMGAGGAAGVTGTTAVGGSTGAGGGAGSDAGSDLASEVGSAGGSTASGGRTGAGGALDASGDTTTTAKPHDGSSDTAPPPTPKSGCGCSVADGFGAPSMGAGWLIASAVLLRRRRQTKRGSTGRSSGKGAGPGA